MADNTVTLVGVVGNEPERVATGGGELTRFRLVTNERRRQPDGRWVDGRASWFRVAAFGDLGLHAKESLRKGQRVVVQGTLLISEYEVEGVRRSSAEVTAQALGHDLQFGTSAFTRDERGRQAGPSAPQADAGDAPRPEPALAAAGDWGAAPGDDATPF